MARGSKKRVLRQKRSSRNFNMSKNPSGSISALQDKPEQELKEQYLFLLELFVYRITGDRLAKLNQMFFVPTTVTFEFLHFKGEDAIEITPVDLLFEPRAGIVGSADDDSEYFYAGRSAMFAFERSLITDKFAEFIIHITVTKKMPEGIRPDVYVGETDVDFSKHFAALRKEMLQCWYGGVPPPKTLEGRTVLINDDVQVGAIEIFIRMSTFGQTIVTEFHSPSSEDSRYIFKGEELNEKALVYECRMVDSDNVEMSDQKETIPSCPMCMKERRPCLPCGTDFGAVLSEDNGGLLKSCPPSPSPCSCPPCPIPSARCGPCGPCGPCEPCGKAVVLKVSGLVDVGDGKKRPTVTVAPASEATGPCTPPDPEHDVFILRIGKKGLVGAGEKSDLQLEMRTPKGPERRPPIRYETREIQTDIDKPKKDGKRKKKKKK